MIRMRKKIIEFMRQNGIAVFAEADKGSGVIHIEKLGSLESWDLFQQLVLYSEVDVLCDRTRSKFPFQVWGQGDTGCLISWLDENKATAMFFDSERKEKALTDWLRILDQKVRMLYKSVE